MAWGACIAAAAAALLLLLLAAAAAAGANGDGGVHCLGLEEAGSRSRSRSRRALQGQGRQRHHHLRSSKFLPSLSSSPIPFLGSFLPPVFLDGMEEEPMAWGWGRGALHLPLRPNALVSASNSSSLPLFIIIDSFSVLGLLLGKQ